MKESLIADFKEAIARFEPSDVLRKKQYRADAHRAEFIERYPLERISRLRFDEFRAPYKNRDDFSSWITTRTNDVVFGRLAWGLNRLGAEGYYPVGRIAESLC